MGRWAPNEEQITCANLARLEEGLPPLRPGEATCLSCGDTFSSWDVTLNRRCNRCSDTIPTVDPFDNVYLHPLSNEVRFPDSSDGKGGNGPVKRLQSNYLRRGPVKVWGDELDLARQALGI